METVIFSTTIAAPGDRVWRTLLDDGTYRQWTSVFAEGSYAVTDWKEGSKTLFLSPGGSGLVSRIVTHRANEFLEIEHLGTIKDGVEDLESPQSEGWVGARETYTLTEAPGGVTLTIHMDTLPSHRAYFEQTWPQALAKVKELSES